MRGVAWPHTEAETNELLRIADGRDHSAVAVACGPGSLCFVCVVGANAELIGYKGSSDESDSHGHAVRMRAKGNVPPST